MTPDVEDHSFEEAEEMGLKLAEVGLAVMRKAETVKIADHVLRFTRHEFTSQAAKPTLQNCNPPRTPSGAAR